MKQISKAHCNLVQRSSLTLITELQYDLICPKNVFVLISYLCNEMWNINAVTMQKAEMTIK